MSKRDGAGEQARTTAARVLAKVVGEGRSLSAELPIGIATLDAAKDRSFVQAMCFGVLRDFERLQCVLDQLLDKPLKRRDAELRCLLLAGIYQIAHMKVPDHAAVAATVGAAARIGRHSAKGLVNAVLRRFIREQAVLMDAAVETPEGRYRHHDWLIKKLQEDWPADWQCLLDEGATQPPMWLRVNTSRISRDEYLCRIEDDEATTGRHAPESIRLSRAVDVQSLPGFAEGLVSVQDAGAQLAAHLLQPKAGQKILDACAAPGGKACHVLELCPGARVTALDIAAERLKRVEENLARLHLDARLICANATHTDQWWDGQRFDSILLDAPCTASGVIRRHPDIKLLRREQDIATLARRQAELLNALWPLLAPGGRLVFCTCSLFAAEGVDQVRDFLHATHGSELLPLDVDWGRDMNPGRQLLTGKAGMDGFYYACLVKSGE
ncbi:MAG: 16S rRNA (cytosine(967)-C(5))-methyltransferase RsmB [Gammaproteobacteria bacterium]